MSMNASPSLASWQEAIITVAKHYRLDVSEERLKVNQEWLNDDTIERRLATMVAQAGMTLFVESFSDAMFDAWRLPLVIEFQRGQIGILESIDNQGRGGIRLSGEHGVIQPFALEEIKKRAVRVLIMRPETSVPDVRVDEYIKAMPRNWFWLEALRDWKRYGDVMLASLLANMLALAVMIFSMQVYDRVIPAQSIPTLWVLFGGVLLALSFEFTMRLARSHISDLIGKRADLRISDKVFGRALRIRNDARSKSTGSFISQIRELEQVRELITSTTLSTLADLPFFLFFLAILWYIGGAIALIPMMVLPLLVIPGLLAQRPLKACSTEGMRESAIRNAMLVEAVQGIEDIKLMRAEPRFQNQWNHLNDVTAKSSMKQRFITNTLMTWTQSLQSLVYALMILCGCFLVMDGEMTTGALIGTAILSSRMIAPLAQISGVMSRWQQAKVAKAGLDDLMKKPVDNPEHGKRLHRPAFYGHYQLKDVVFQYEENAKKAALEIGNLQIQAGERIAILGRNGAGKSTLLQLLAGMQLPQRGDIGIDTLSMPLIEPYDLRRDIGYLRQNATLFFGTLRDNVTMGRPTATDEEIVNALKLSGALDFVQQLPDGLDYMLTEGGKGLSGGQRQALLLARTLIRAPNILLLDEPTAWLDDITEQQIIHSLTPWLQNRTLIIATHRPAVLQWVNRIIVMDNGRIVLDGSTEKVLASLRSPAANSNAA